MMATAIFLLILVVWPSKIKSAEQPVADRLAFEVFMPALFRPFDRAAF
jgi:hypothetical protein